MRRRSFLERTALTLAAAGIIPGKALSGRNGVVAAARVEPGMRNLRSSIDQAMAVLADIPGPEAWGRFFTPADRVAVKLNCLAGPFLAPHREVVEAVVEGIRSAGAPDSAIVLFDRTSDELARAGFPIRRDDHKVRCFGTDALKGGGYGEEIVEHRSIGSLMSRILTDFATVLVNVGVAKDHDLCGVSAGVKNLYGIIHNPNRYHANRCDPFLADLLDHPAIRPKLRLTVIDALQAQCHGGPAYNPVYTFHPNRVLLSADPVACDAIIWDWIEQERSRRGLPSLSAEKREPTWLATAERHGLGVADPAKITLVEVDG